jgi:hypothetical protein
MQFISCHDGKLQTLTTAGLSASSAKSFATGLEALDALAPRHSFARGAVHELLFDANDGQPRFVAAMLAQAAAEHDESRRYGGTEARRVPSSGSDALRASSAFVPSCLLPIVWTDPRHEIYPPALAALGFDLTKLYSLHPPTEADEAWAVAECLRCRGVGAVIAAPPRMSRIVARRLQLAAERGGSVGILLRQTGRNDSIYAAATRWKVSPHPGERTIQRWKIQLLHGHGGRVNQTVILEWCRETNTVRATEKLADRPVAAQAPRRIIA